MSQCTRPERRRPLFRRQQCRQGRRLLQAGVRRHGSHVSARGAAGAEVLMPVSEMFWSDRYGQLRDPFGIKWSIATPIGMS